MNYRVPSRILSSLFAQLRPKKSSYCRALTSVPEVPTTLNGWVRSVRKQKDLVFINIQSENSLETDQIITSRKDIPRDVLRRITHGASLHCCGEYVSAPMQARKDFMASSVEVLGECSPESYPFKNNVRHSLEYLRQFTHLRTRSKLFAAIMRVRSAATLHILNHFTTQGYTLIHTPILTSCDCEGAGEVFSAETREEGNEKFFNTPVNLTVSGQLHAEAAAAGLKRVFTFGPTFRSDKSHTRRHLAEFYMLEAEVCFTQDLDDVISPVSTLYRDLSRTLLNTCHKDIEFIHTSVGSREYVNNLTGFVDAKEYIRMSYTEAVDVLRAKSSSLTATPPKWGEDLRTEHEQFLVDFVGNQPLFVTNYPKTLKPFYARTIDGSPQLVSCFDLLVPGVGELVGGSLREERYNVLAQRLEEASMLESYQWYLDLRRFGSVPHGGFGMGFERYLQHLLNLEHIRDVIPFPRMMKSCPM